jgi:hypothetical protein
MSGIGHNGGPAFPVEGQGAFGPITKSAGMSLRDYFAGQAILGTQVNAWEDCLTVDQNAKVVATWAYAIADAMLAVRGQS